MKSFSKPLLEYFQSIFLSFHSKKVFSYDLNSWIVTNAVRSAFVSRPLSFWATPSVFQQVTVFGEVKRKYNNTELIIWTFCATTNTKRWLTTLSFWATPCLQRCCSSNTLKLHMGGISWNNTVKNSQTHRTPEIVEHIMEQHWAATEICSLYFAVFSNELGKVVWVALYSVSWGSAVWIGCSRRSWFWLISPFSPRDTIHYISGGHYTLYVRGTAGI